MPALHVSYYSEAPSGRHVWGDGTLTDVSGPPRCAEDIEVIRAELVRHVQRAFPEFRYPGFSVVIVAWNVMP